MADTKLTGLTVDTTPNSKDLAYGVKDPTGSPLSRKIAWENAPAGGYGLTEGRLTLTTALAVTTADVTAATTIYFTPYKGEQVMIYTGTGWYMHALTELSIAVPSTTVTPFDIFIDYNAGTPALKVTDWTNDTTRATALTTQDGVYVQTGNTDWKYLGTGRTTSVSGQIEDSLTKRFLWNYYNRVTTALTKSESTATWTYQTSTYRPLNNSTANRIELVCGVSEDMISLDAMVVVLSDAVNPRYVGIGVNSTVANTWQILIRSAGIAYSLAHTKLKHNPAVGYSYFQCLEYGSGTGTQTWYGGNEPGIAGIWFR